MGGLGSGWLAGMCRSATDMSRFESDRPEEWITTSSKLWRRTASTRDQRYTCFDCQPVLRLVTSDVKGNADKPSISPTTSRGIRICKRLRIGTKVPSAPRQPPNRPSKSTSKSAAGSYSTCIYPVGQFISRPKRRGRMSGAWRFSSPKKQTGGITSTSASTYVTNLGSHLTATVVPRPRIRAFVSTNGC